MTIPQFVAEASLGPSAAKHGAAQVRRTEGAVEPALPCCEVCDWACGVYGYDDPWCIRCQRICNPYCRNRRV